MTLLNQLCDGEASTHGGQRPEQKQGCTQEGVKKAPAKSPAITAPKPKLTPVKNWEKKGKS